MDAYFSEKISAAVPREMHEAATRAAVAQGVTLADLVRSAVSAHLTARGVPHPLLPALRRTTYLNRMGAGR